MRYNEMGVKLRFYGRSLFYHEREAFWSSLWLFSHLVRLGDKQEYSVEAFLEEFLVLVFCAS